MKILTQTLIVLLCIVTSALAQTPKSYTIKGEAVDSATMKPIGFATVVLKDSTVVVKAVASDTNGKFSFTYDKSGKYTLQIAFVGYTPIEQQIELNTESVADLGKLYLNEGVAIDAAVVVGQLITNDIDKTVYNTAMDPEAISQTALEMMRKVPMLTVDGDDNIQLKGQGNYKILVNGKVNTMMSKNYKEVLRSMPASSIKNIEIITNPPAKYDSEGIAGIINIITVRKTNDSYNGSVGLRADNYGGYGGNGYIAASLGKFTLSTSVYAGVHRSPKNSSWQEINYIDEVVNNVDNNFKYKRRESTGSSSYNGKYGNLSMEASYEIDTFNLITMSVWGYMGSGNNEGNNNTNFLTAQRDIQMAFATNNTSKYSYGSMSGNIDWQRTFAKPDKTITASYKLDFSPETSEFSNGITGKTGYDVLYPDYYNRSRNKSNGSEHTIQVDYFDPLTKEHNIEFGVKYIMRPNTSDSDPEIKDAAGNWIVNLNNKNDLDYFQHIVGAYGGYQYKKNKFGAKGGLRAEYTVNTGTFKVKDTKTDVFGRYFNLVPYLTLSYKVSQSGTMRLGYTQRLQRPGIWYLNPYVNDDNPYNISTGNPNLESEIRHSFDLNYNAYSQKGNINASLSASFGNNAIERVTTTINNDVYFTTYENCGRRQNYSAYVGVGKNFLKGKMRVNIGLNGGYSIVESIYDSKLNNSGFTHGGNINFYTETWKNASVSLYGGYGSGGIGLQTKSSGYNYSGFNISQAFLKDKKLRINVGVSNPFKENETRRNEMFDAKSSSISEYVYQARRFNIGLNYRFGQSMTQVKKTRRGISNDDKMGGGGQGGSQGGGGGQQ